jgi:hypothetical protein
MSMINGDRRDFLLADKERRNPEDALRLNAARVFSVSCAEIDRIYLPEFANAERKKAEAEFWVTYDSERERLKADEDRQADRRLAALRDAARQRALEGREFVVDRAAIDLATKACRAVGNHVRCGGRIGSRGACGVAARRGEIQSDGGFGAAARPY